MDGARPTLLLHVCCGPCATHVIEVLRGDYALTLFFANSNIHPAEEYQARLEAARHLAATTGLELVEDEYNHAAWLAHVQGLEHAPEGGARCARCFGYNLGRAAECARVRGIDCFTTTLTVSPHKNAATIFAVGQDLGAFVAADFKQADGFRRSVALSKEYGLYRQRYCGCEFSHRE
jgi:predicted adenine nucleotide alpha hydrolase (AANH) superfamily ATPase